MLWWLHLIISCFVEYILSSLTQHAFKHTCYLLYVFPQRAETRGSFHQEGNKANLWYGSVGVLRPNGPTVAAVTVANPHVPIPDPAV